MRFCTVEYHAMLKLPERWWSEHMRKHERLPDPAGDGYLEWAECANCKSTLMRRTKNEGWIDEKTIH